MSTQELGQTWTEANQRHLSASVGLVRAMLAAHAAGARGETTDGLDDARMRVREAESGLSGPAAIDSLSAAFGLSAFERQVVLLCAGMELDGAFPSQVAAAHGDPHRIHPTFGLALAALPDAHWSAVTPSGPLRRWRLIEVLHGDTMTSSGLRIDERVLHYLAGTPHPDDRLAGLLTPVAVQASDEVPPSLHRTAHRVREALARAAGPGGRTAVQVHGDDHSVLVRVSATACAELGMQLFTLRATDVPGTAEERETLARLLEREAVLGRAAVLVDVDEGDGPEVIRNALGLVEAMASPVVLAVRDPIRTRFRSALRVHVERPGPDEQRDLWRRALGPAAAALNGWLDRIVSQFRLELPAIEEAGAEVLARSRDGEVTGDDLGPILWDACREQAAPRLDDLTQRITPVAGWEDIVLPEQQLQTLREVATHVRHRARVYETWGFAAKSARGLGISALFAGPSGTGKTMAAEVLARDLRLDLYRIDLSQVVSKYIGETEKNLRRVFDAAEEGGAVLLFDEADALFGKRSEVRDSHDRYANIEVSYLLQRMESYRGLAILTTNMKSALDTAFLRRLRFVVQFPFPDSSQREEIWRRVFPPETPTEGLDPVRLGRLGVAGGNIRNIAMNAAFLAADANEPVRMAHLLRAARAEYTKMEKPLTDAEVGGWT